MMRRLYKRRLWLYRVPLDFRKQIDGRIQVVAAEMEKTPSDGSIYIFRNRKKDKMKLLSWDRSGFVMGYKRLEKGRFDFPNEKEGTVALNWAQMDLLFSGLPLVGMDPKSIPHFF